jgi:hypothetical protein
MCSQNLERSVRSECQSGNKSQPIISPNLSIIEVSSLRKPKKNNFRIKSKLMNYEKFRQIKTKT